MGRKRNIFSLFVFVHHNVHFSVASVESSCDTWLQKDDSFGWFCSWGRGCCRANAYTPHDQDVLSWNSARRRSFSYSVSFLCLSRPTLLPFHSTLCSYSGPAWSCSFTFEEKTKKWMPWCATLALNAQLAQIRKQCYCYPNLHLSYRAMPVKRYTPVEADGHEVEDGGRWADHIEADVDVAHQKRKLPHRAHLKKKVLVNLRDTQKILKRWEPALPCARN